MPASVIIEIYNAEWPAHFSSEQQLLHSILGNEVIIEHIGSTSVEGLSAKPIIDIMIGVRSLSDAAAMIAPIENLGYNYIQKYEAEFPHRRYFNKKRTDETHTHHIHLVEKGSEFWNMHLYFRDRLRSDKDLSDRYAALKNELAVLHRNDREAYTDAKTSFIRAVTDERRDAARPQVRSMANDAVASGNVTGWFEEVYQNAKGDRGNIPWADAEANPYLVSWLAANKNTDTNKTALVIGCGLGDDAEALSKAGYRVTAFDVSETAIEWAKQRFPNSTVTYQPADLFALPKEWIAAFDLVFECYTVQALPPTVRDEAIRCVCEPVAPNGQLLVVARGWRGEHVENGPPWPITNEELSSFSSRLREVSFEEFYEEPNTIRRIRCLYHRDPV